MTRVASPPPQSAPKKSVNKLETVWIDWLNRSSGSQVSGSAPYKDFEAKRGIDLLADSDLNLRRAAKLNQDVDLEMERFALIRANIAPTTATEVNHLAAKARKAIAKDLSVPKNNEEALAAISTL